MKDLLFGGADRSDVSAKLRALTAKERKLVNLRTINQASPTGNVTFYVAEADDGTFWQAMLWIGADGIHFKAPSKLSADVSLWRDGWAPIENSQLPPIELQ